MAVHLTLFFSSTLLLKTLRLRQNGRHFADNILKSIFLNDNIWIQIKISLKFVPKGSINNIPAVVQIIAWGRPGDKPLSEPMMLRLPTHICVTGPQWVNNSAITTEYYDKIQLFYLACPDLHISAATFGGKTSSVYPGIMIWTLYTLIFIYGFMTLLSVQSYNSHICCRYGTMISILEYSFLLSNSNR